MKNCLLSITAISAATTMFCARASAASFEAFTEPYRTIEVAAAELGIVQQLLVREGDRVVQGQTLATLDSDVLVVSKEIADANVEAKGKLDSARAELELRRTRLQRLLPLREQGHASQEEIDRAAAELAMSEANLRGVQEQQRLDGLERKKIDAMLERRKVRSPIDGVVTKVHREEQEFVSNSSPALVTVVQLDPLRVVFTVPTSFASSLKVGQSVPLGFPDGGERADGTIELVAPVTDAESGTVRIKVLVSNPRGQHRAGVRCALDLAGAPLTKTPPSGLTVGEPQLQ